MSHSRSLRDLGAVFISYTNGSIVERGELLAGAQGVMFRCPVGAHEPQPACAHSVIVWFNMAPVEATPLRRYFPMGTSIDDLTLTPSVHINQPYVNEQGAYCPPPKCRWRGWVKRGQVSA